MEVNKMITNTMTCVEVDSKIVIIEAQAGELANPLLHPNRVSCCLHLSSVWHLPLLSENTQLQV